MWHCIRIFLLTRLINRSSRTHFHKSFMKWNVIFDGPTIFITINNSHFHFDVAYNRRREREENFLCKRQLFINITTTTKVLLEKFNDSELEKATISGYRTYMHVSENCYYISIHFKRKRQNKRKEKLIKFEQNNSLGNKVLRTIYPNKHELIQSMDAFKIEIWCSSSCLIP